MTTSERLILENQLTLLLLIGGIYRHGGDQWVINKNTENARAHGLDRQIEKTQRTLGAEP